MLKKDDVRDIIRLKDKEKLTYQEIANKFSTNPSTIFYRYKLGKERYPETFKENSKNLQNISKENLENSKNSLEKSDNPIPDIVKKVENPKNWRQKKESGVAVEENRKSLEDNSLKKSGNTQKQKGIISEQKEGEGKSRAIKVNNGNWLFLIIIAGILAFIVYMVVKELKSEGGGGSKVKSPEPSTPVAPSVPKIPEGREWAR